MIPTFTNNHNRYKWSQQMRSRKAPLIDYERGGVALSDPSEGLNAYDWTAEYVPSEGWVSVWREDLGVGTKTQVLQVAGITRIAFAFDQNMRPQIAYVDGAGVHLWYYSAGDGGMVTRDFPGTSDPCLTLDDRRDGRASESDVIFSYITGDSLAFRVQRENYDVERSTVLDELSNLEGAGMTAPLRFQWETRKIE